jgi:chloride channel protein, CIC family
MLGMIRKAEDWFSGVTPWMRRQRTRFSGWIYEQDTLYLSALAILVGILAGYGALLLRFGIEWVSLAWTGERIWEDAMPNLPWFVYIGAPVIGGLAAGWINTKWLPAGQTRGVAGVLESLSERSGRIDGRHSTSDTVGSIIGVGSGASAGREGPTVAMGAAIASYVGHRLKLSEQQMRTLIGCGVASGIASSFNAPIAGVLFALEVILADYAISTFSPIVISSVIATVITRAELGNFPAFTIPEYRLVSGWEIPIYVGLGIFCGLLAEAWLRMMPPIRKRLERHVPKPIYRPAAAGLVLGLCALVVPQIMSVGYGTVDSMLWERLDPTLLHWALPVTAFLAIVLLVKVFATALCAAGGFGGGEIGPSIFIGATAGALYGGVVHHLMPFVSETYGGYALVAAGAMMAAALQAPMTTILMVFEMSGDYHIMVPLMASCIVATLVKRAFGHESVFTEVLEARGIDTAWTRERSWMRAVPVRKIPWRSTPEVSEHAKLEELKRVYVSSGKGCVQVVDDDGLMIGIVTFGDLQQWLLDPTLDQIVLAGEVANRNISVISEDGNLLQAINMFDRETFEQMPVVAYDDPRRVLGILSRNAVFSTYHALIVKHGEESAGDHG